MREELEQVVTRLIHRELERRRLADSIRSHIHEYILTSSPSPFTGTIGAVDGGLLHEDYGPIILILVRAVGVLFEYEDSSLSRVGYIPSPLPDPEIIVNDTPLEREDYHPFRSLHRLRAELERALEVAPNCDVLFLDGSIVPQIVDKPRAIDSPLIDLYNTVLDLYKELYRTAPLLASVVKDSRGDRLGRFLSKKGIKIPNWQDVSWLNYVLREGEYTYPIPYSDEPEKHATLKDLGHHARNIYLFYIRPSPYDRPYRVEFYSKNPEEDATTLASLLYPLSSLNPHYSIPPFLVEADLRARLSRESLSHIKSYIERRVAATFPHLRIFERRPW